MSSLLPATGAAVTRLSLSSSGEEVLIGKLAPEVVIRGSSEVPYIFPPLPNTWKDSRGPFLSALSLASYASDTLFVCVLMHDAVVYLGKCGADVPDVGTRKNAFVAVLSRASDGTWGEIVEWLPCPTGAHPCSLSCTTTWIAVGTLEGQCMVWERERGNEWSAIEHEDGFSASVTPVRSSCIVDDDAGSWLIIGHYERAGFSPLGEPFVGSRCIAVYHLTDACTFTFVEEESIRPHEDSANEEKTEKPSTTDREQSVVTGNLVQSSSNTVPRNEATQPSSSSVEPPAAVAATPPPALKTEEPTDSDDELIDLDVFPKTFEEKNIVAKDAGAAERSSPIPVSDDEEEPNAVSESAKEAVAEHDLVGNGNISATQENSVSDEECTDSDDSDMDLDVAAPPPPPPSPPTPAPELSSQQTKKFPYLANTWRLNTLPPIVQMQVCGHNVLLTHAIMPKNFASVSRSGRVEHDEGLSLLLAIDWRTGKASCQLGSIKEPAIGDEKESKSQYYGRIDDGLALVQTGRYICSDMYPGARFCGAFGSKDGSVLFWKGKAAQGNLLRIASHDNQPVTGVRMFAVGSKIPSDQEVRTSAQCGTRSFTLFESGDPTYSSRVVSSDLQEESTFLTVSCGMDGHVQVFMGDLSISEPGYVRCVADFPVFPGDSIGITAMDVGCDHAYIQQGDVLTVVVGTNTGDVVQFFLRIESVDPSARNLVRAFLTKEDDSQELKSEQKRSSSQHAAPSLSFRRFLLPAAGHQEGYESVMQVRHADGGKVPQILHAWMETPLFFRWSSHYQHGAGSHVGRKLREFEAKYSNELLMLWNDSDGMKNDWSKMREQRETTTVVSSTGKIYKFRRPPVTLRAHESHEDRKEEIPFETIPPVCTVCVEWPTEEYCVTCQCSGCRGCITQLHNKSKFRHKRILLWES